MKALQRLRKRLAESVKQANRSSLNTTAIGQAYQRGRRDAFDQALGMVVWEINNIDGKEASEW